MKSLSRTFVFFHPLLRTRFSSSVARHDELWRNVRVCVWWDFENCHLPSGVNVFKVGQAITSALRANGIKGPLQITAFGDVMQLSRANQEALSATGITLTHIPSGGKNSSDRSLLVDLMYWVSQNPPPAHLFLISGDRDFANILHRLRMSNYNILLATKSDAPGVLCSAASIMWKWNSLLKMEELKGTHFNLPPDGSYGSWYGNSKVPLEDPFAGIEQPTCLPRENSSSASCSELQVRPIPEVVQKQIRDLLNLHPDGMLISDFGHELRKNNVVLDKDLYGYKKLSRFLLSMRNVLKVHTNSDGRYIIRSISAKSVEPYVPSQTSVTKDQLLAKSSKGNGKEASISQLVDVKTSLPPSSKEHLRQVEKHQPPVVEEANDKDASICQPVGVKTSLPPSSNEHLRKIKKYQPSVAENAAKVDRKPLETAKQPSLVGENVDLVNAQLTGSSVKDKDVSSEVGSFKNWLQKILYGGVVITENKSSDSAEVQISGDISDQRTLAVQEKCITSGDSAGIEAKVIDLKSPSKGSVSVKPASCSGSTTEPILESKTAFDSDAYEEKSGKSLGLFSRILNWFKFKSRGSNSERSSDEPSQELQQTNSSLGKHQIFAEDSFWKDLESFMGTKNALLIISNSTTRQQIAQNLQKEGPLVLRTLKENDILELVDMLISEKKWVEECPSEASPFKLTRHVQSHTSSTTGSPSNGLRSFFSNELAKPNLRSADKRIQNVSHTGVTGRLAPTNRTHLGRTKKEMLNDCHKLANEVVEEFPEGYSVHSFRKLFVAKYGYDIDIRRLGYEKLACLLQTIPGLKVESSIIIPARKALKSEGQCTAVSDNVTYDESGESNCESSDASEKEDEPDSLWDELGPVAKIGSKRTVLESPLHEMRTKGAPVPTHADYEPILSDDDLSDSDGENRAATQKKNEAKPPTTEDSSSLLKLLHLCDDNDRGDDKTRGSEDVQGEADSDINCLETGNSLGRGRKLSYSTGMKQKPQKHYSFVADTGGSSAEKQFEIDNRTDKVLDSILSNINRKI